jgi:hypothetical protein
VPAHCVVDFTPDREFRVEIACGNELKPGGRDFVEPLRIGEEGEGLFDVDRNGEPSFDQAACRLLPSIPGGE